MAPGPLGRSAAADSGTHSHEAGRSTNVGAPASHGSASGAPSASRTDGYAVVGTGPAAPAARSSAEQCSHSAARVRIRHSVAPFRG